MDAEEIQATLTAPAALPLTPAPAGSGPTLRERYRRAMTFRRVDRLPNFEFGYWDETLPEWHQQGLPPEITNEAKAYAYFGIENWGWAPVDVMGLRPWFEYKVIEENADYVTYVDGGSGCIARINKQGHKSIPHYLDFRLKDRRSWEEFKERLQAGPERVPANWPALAAQYNQRDYPLAIGIGSMIGSPRNWIGFENIAMMVYDDPELLEDIVETLCRLVCDTLARVLPDVEFDLGFGWEDICFNSGPIVGVPFMRDIVAPRYKRITDLLKRHGCHVSLTDCDGNILPVIPSFLAGGINCMFPVEVHGGSEPVTMRQRWPDILMQGGVCKMKLAEGKAAIRAELERIQPLVLHGGFIPGVDHRVPAGIKLDTYKYYLKLKRDLFGVGGTPQYDESKVG